MFLKKMKDTILKLEGNLTITSAKTIHKKMLNILKQQGDIIVDINNGEKIDISLLQLLCSLYTSCLEKKKKMIIKADDNFWGLLENAGYLRGELLSCKDN